MEKIDTPYLSVQFILREFSKAFGTKKSNKAIDDACKQLEINPYKFEELKRDLIHQPIEEAVNIHFADHVCQQVDIVFKQYIELMNVIPLDGVSATSAQSLIGQKYLSSAVGFICSEMLDGMRTTPSSLAKGEQTAIQFVFQNIEKNSVWQRHLQDATKEQKDRYRVWQKGKDGELPDLKTIASLGEKGKTQEEVMTWGVIKARLITARFWDYFFLRSGIGELNAITKGDISTQLKEFTLDLHHLQQVEGEKYKISTPIALELFDSLRLRKPKSLGDKKKSKRLLGELLDVQSRLDKLDETTYYYYWMNARHHLHCGELAPSIDSYKRAFELAVYRSGENLTCIVTEAVIVASRLPKPDKVFINRLRAVSGLFDIAILPLPQRNGGKKKPEFIENWEVSTYSQYFDSYFPQDTFFPGSDYPPFQGKKYGMWFVDGTKHKPDLAKPNRRITVGELDGLTKRMPQLTYFSMQEDEKAVQDLLDAGANVNVKSEANESPLLMAVQAMQATLVPLNSMRDVMFKAISSKPHSKDILNLITSKKKLTVLGTAVQSGRLDVVERVLQLGADVDQRQELGWETPLFSCLGLITNHKCPSMVAALINSSRNNDQSLRALMSNAAGMVPPEKHHLMEHIHVKENDPVYTEIMNEVTQYQIDNIHKHTSVEELREVAKKLIDFGADPNAKHVTAMLGYTPLMLAAELDEGDLFEYMLTAGGDVQSTCVVTDTKRRVSCIEIARNWRAKSVLQAIEKLMLSEK
ncbi:ankyrin repeat domain-containing protein [Photobacterium sanguinicancri]|uniref:Ankyrin repeat domain-containing protein n=1 Tax=Photobacterium sanguinicancri TaxID=875932 RepID=A0AAW7Y6Y7_9GAMM|nr:ankyrin repeat domain-containing protein [Photobacterium sanguinicancri]MDO6543254.1 ankyrin repeat domain-containing protein [Photobacterium sanguinicancri]